MLDGVPTAERPDTLQAMLANPGEVQKLLTVEQVAERLQVSKWSVYRRIEAGELPAIRLGSTNRAPLRISERELQAWLFKEEADV
jgi:excisionase family DNA binding protein